MSIDTTHQTRHTVIGTDLGELTMVRDELGLTGIYFPGHWTKPDPQTYGATVSGDDLLGEVAGQLQAYLRGDRRDFDLPLHLVGSPRARDLWQLLQDIPYGETTTYGALANQLGGGISARAVGGFVGHNPISIIVPCHRVVGSTGKLTGYAGGLERKQRLLELEGAIPAALVPCISNPPHKSNA